MSWASSQERARLKSAVIQMYGTECYLCGAPITVMTGRTPESFSIDHVESRNSGGSSTDLLNLRPCHLRCNVMKSDKPLNDYHALHENALDWALNLE